MGRTTSIRRAAAGSALLLAALLAGGAGADPRGAFETTLISEADLVALGEAWWTRSLDPADPVACATCHFNPGLVRRWAAGFPKVKPLPPPHGRVMTLLQANAEAVTRHYGLADPRPAAIAITAYLSALGAHLPRSPGVSPGQPVFAARIAELRRSVERGRGLFVARCAARHAGSAVAGAVARFPRVRRGHAESTEGFLEGHAPAELPAGGLCGLQSTRAATSTGRWPCTSRRGRRLRSRPPSSPPRPAPTTP